jgi:hypothetical protein
MSTKIGSGTSDRYNVESTNGNSDAIAELGARLKCLDASREVVELYGGIIFALCPESLKP